MKKAFAEYQSSFILDKIEKSLKEIEFTRARKHDELLQEYFEDHNLLFRLYQESFWKKPLFAVYAPWQFNKKEYKTLEEYQIFLEEDYIKTESDDLWRHYFRKLENTTRYYSDEEKLLEKLKTLAKDVEALYIDLETYYKLDYWSK